MESKKKYFMDCHLAGRKYHDADEVWDKLKVGTVLPREDNETVASILEMGWTDMFECRISKINEEAHPEYQVHLIIKIKRNIA